MNCSLCHERIQKGWAFVRKYDVICKDCKQSIVKKKKEAKKTKEEAARLAAEAKKKKNEPVEELVDVTVPRLDTMIELANVCTRYIASYGFTVTSFAQRGNWGHGPEAQKNFVHMDYVHDNFRIRTGYNDDYEPLRRYTEIAYNTYKKLMTIFSPDKEEVKRVIRENPINGPDPSDYSLSSADQQSALQALPIFGKLTQKEIDFCMAMTDEQISIYEGLLENQNKYKKMRKKRETVLAGDVTHGYAGRENTTIYLSNKLYVCRHYAKCDNYLEVAKVEREPSLSYFTLPIKNTDTRGDKIDLLMNKVLDLKNLRQWLENQ